MCIINLKKITNLLTKRDAIIGMQLQCVWWLIIFEFTFSGTVCGSWGSHRHSPLSRWRLVLSRGLRSVGCPGSVWSLSGPYPRPAQWCTPLGHTRKATSAVESERWKWRLSIINTTLSQGERQFYIGSSIGVPRAYIGRYMLPMWMTTFTISSIPFQKGSWWKLGT